MYVFMYKYDQKRSTTFKKVALTYLREFADIFAAVEKNALATPSVATSPTCLLAHTTIHSDN